MHSLQSEKNTRFYKKEKNTSFIDCTSATAALPIPTITSLKTLLGELNNAHCIIC